ncbi:DUF2599 domain-containing protein [Luteipulveratus mongoliensis]|uniref:DUF2599 domain-containing protein n=1 Tax=Luteipulveratus mongoliensis TaxID=571913 RepID=UPI0012EEC07F|nr:DUF2599 domain-containing protein [Luteipulveratus mongoliensis]
MNQSTRKLALRGIVLALVSTMYLAALGGPAHADVVYPVAWTNIGIFPRTAPSMGAPAAGAAVSDGTSVQIACETTGESVSNGASTSTIWEQLSDGSYLPNAHIDTGSDDWTPNVPRCGGGASATPSASGSGWVPYCGPSKYFSDISVERWSNGDFKIIAWPTWEARTASDPTAATIDEWHAIQNCVSGLYGTLADSIYDQLECHQHLALVPGKNVWATGTTYDLESWRGTFDNWLGTRCGNELNKERDHTDAPTSNGQPDEGVTDIAPPTTVG